MILEGVGGTRRLLIWVGASGGVALAALLEKEETPRTLTIVFAWNLVRKLGGTLREIRISKLEHEACYAVATLEGPEGISALDARPSDALALGAPIRVDPTMLAAAAHTMEGTQGKSAEPHREAGRGAPEIVAEARDRWRTTRAEISREDPSAR
jgi:uncharacterized protein